MTEPEQIAALHERYVKASGRPEQLRFYEHAWHDLLHMDPYHGDIEALTRDVGFVVWYLKGQIEREKRMPGALRLRNLLQPDQFTSDLAEAIGQCPKKYKAHCAAKARPTPPASGAPATAAAPPPDPQIVSGFGSLMEKLKGPSGG